jgi:O-antigen ligase
MVKIDNIKFVILLGIVAIIPFKIKMVSVLIVLFIILTLFQKQFYQSLKKYISYLPFSLAIIFYLLHVIGLAWSENMKYGLFDVGVKLNLIIFPLIFIPGIATISVDRRKITRLIFIISVSAATIFCLARALLRMPDTGMTVWYYREFSFFMHPSYFSMYICLAIIFIFDDFLYGPISSLMLKIFQLAFLFILIAGLVLLSSKAGLLVLALIFVAYLFMFGRVKSKRKYVLFLTGVLVLLIAVGSQSTILKSRIHQFTESVFTPPSNHNLSSTSARMLIWPAAVSVARESLFFGTGTGDIKDMLKAKYVNMGQPELAKMNLNAHNQFLQTTVALGLTGVLVLITLLGSLVVNAVVRRDLTALLFAMIIFVNAMVESILEVQAGIIFFALFSTLLFDPVKRSSILSKS